MRKMNLLKETIRERSYSKYAPSEVETFSYFSFLEDEIVAL